MNCPICFEKTGVIDTRHTPDSVTRRRECTMCGYRFDTVEIDEDLYSKLVNKPDRLIDKQRKEDGKNG